MNDQPENQQAQPVPSPSESKAIPAAAADKEPSEQDAPENRATTRPIDEDDVSQRNELQRSAPHTDADRGTPSLGTPSLGMPSQETVPPNAPAPPAVPPSAAPEPSVAAQGVPRSVPDPITESFFSPPAAKDVNPPMSIPPTPDPAAPPSAAPQVEANICPNCKRLNRAGVLVCEFCATPLVAGEKDAVSTKKFNQEPIAPAAPPPQTANLSEAGLAADAGAAPNAPQPPAVPSPVASMIDAIRSAGTDRFERDMVLRFEIEGSPQPILFFPKPETNIGRRDPVTGSAPEIDLTAYAGYRMGVSRNHCVLRLKETRLEVTDLGSSNGTAINGTKLQPHLPVTLRDGDELTLGKMVIRVIFQKRR
ncbi:MAG: FHA domain-containing protein [bacterium]|nr:FHA domain-containing protein [bacterium]